MKTALGRGIAAVFAVVLAMAAAGCGSSRGTHAYHGHNHDYRHGYYNPVDGYFHDDHWHHGHRHTTGCGHSSLATYHYY